MRKELTSHGFSSILFAMIFAVILSLLAVGFATLVRNDQRQTLDQTLGYQAQYAAETAINQVAASLKNDPGFPSTSSNCVDFEVSTGSGVTVPCVTWTDVSDSIIFTGVGIEPKSALVKIASPPPSDNYNKLVITWESDTPVQYTAAELNSAGFPNTIQDNKFPVLRVAFYPQLSPPTKVFYLVPTAAGGGSASISFQGRPSGSINKADCTGSSCTLEINNIKDVGNLDIREGYISITALGSTSTRVVITAWQGNNQRQLGGAQYTIDATAIAQDVTKRVEARIPAGKQTWRPGFSASVNQICKDMRIDGTNNTGISGDNACVNRIP